METTGLPRRQASWLVVCLLAFAFLTRAVLAMLYENHFDLDWYRTWALALPDGFFSAYARLNEGQYALDYPPVYLAFLWLVGLAYRAWPLADYVMTDMLAMKFFPILFDTLAAGMLYLLCRRKSEPLGVLAAALWALNPSALFNSAAWGQTDGMMLCLILFAFWFIEEDKPFIGSILFAVAALTKMQTLYFTPVLFLVLWRRYRLDKALGCFFAAFGTGAAAFVPFIIGGFSRRGWAALLTPFEVYLGGLGKYPYAALNTYNLYGVGNLNWVYDGRSLLFGTYDEELGYAVGGLTYNHLSLVLLIASLAFAAFLVWKGREEYSLWLGCFALMQGVFMLTTRMHERYQIAVLPFALVLYVLTRRTRWLALFGALSLVTFVNQFMLLIRNNTINDPTAPWDALFNPVQTVFSLLNLALFALSMVVCWQTAFPDGVRRKRQPEPAPEPTEEVSP